MWTTKTHKHRDRWSKITPGRSKTSKSGRDTWLNRSAKASGITHNEQCPRKTSHWHIRNAAHRHGFHMISCQYFQPTFTWNNLSQPTSWNLQPYPQLGPHVSFKKPPYPTRSRPAEIFTKRVGDLFSKKTRSCFCWEIPTKIEMLKMEPGGVHGCHKKRCHDRQIASEIQIQRKVNKTTGNYRPCFLSANWCKFLKAKFPQGVFCANLSTIMQVHAQLSFDTRCAYRKPLRRHVKFSNAWHWSWPKSSSGGILKQFWLKSISRIHRWLSKSPAGSIFKVLLLKSSLISLLRFRKRPSGSVLNLLPCK